MFIQGEAMIVAPLGFRDVKKLKVHQIKTMDVQAIFRVNDPSKIL